MPHFGGEVVTRSLSCCTDSLLSSDGKSKREGINKEVNNKCHRGNNQDAVIRKKQGRKNGFTLDK